MGYVSLESLRKAVNDPNCSFCSSCYTGIYPSEGLQLEVAHKSSAPVLEEEFGEHAPGHTLEDAPDDAPEIETAAVEEAKTHES